MLLALLRRPLVWGLAVAAALFAMALFPPGLEKRENGQTALAPLVPPVDELEEPLPNEDLPEAAPVVTGSSPVMVVEEKTPEMSGPGSAEPGSEEPGGVAMTEVAGEPAGKGSAKPAASEAPAAMAEGGPSTTEAGPNETPKPDVPVARVAPMGPPGPEEIRKRLRQALQGPPDAARQTQLLAARMQGPLQGNAFGPPEALLNDAEPVIEGEFAVAGEEEPERSMTQKPTARISAPAAEPRPALEPPPESTVQQPLPPSADHSWEVVKVSGRDYITGRSIQKFYSFSTFKVEGKHVWFRMPNLIVKAQIGSQELLINNVKFIMSYPAISSGGRTLFTRLDLCKLIDPVLRPSYISGGTYFDTVVVDAGHGGHDSGARGVYGYEKEYALEMARELRTALQRRGFKVVMTRDSDKFISLTNRVAIANKTPNSIFISLHYNSASTSASGIETFALTPQGSASSLARGGGFSNVARVGNQFDSENITLATAVHAQVVHRFKVVDRGIKRARWSVLTGCRRPGILFEGGFITNPQENQLIASGKYRSAVASAMGDAVVNFRKALDPNYARRMNR